MDATAERNNLDLVWGLDHIGNKAVAKRFIMQFEKLLCVYSPGVKQLYTHTQILLPIESSGSMVVFPDFHDVTATYSRINTEAVLATNIYIIPGEALKKTGLYIVIKQADQSAKLTPVPINVGLNKIRRILGDEDPFLPLLTKGSLLEIGNGIPCLKLSRLKLSNLTECSKLESNAIKHNIQEKMKAFN